MEKHFEIVQNIFRKYFPQYFTKYFSKVFSTIFYKILLKSILKIQNKNVFSILKIEIYFQKTIFSITNRFYS